MVSAGQAALARMTLAEKGLPHSGSVGNELYDKLGSLGLTSFMQEVTRVRAMEGELARTIQMMRGVKAARVHIVMSDEGSFRRERQAPSASVIIRTDGGDDRMVGQAIRHLVAAAIPSMKSDEVTVLNVDGRLLASGPDSIEKSPDNLLGLEKDVSQEIREKITTTLAPYLSLHNFQVSVAARLNADKTQTNETIYNPDSRAERSMRVVKERQNSQNAAGQPPAGVDANLPKAEERRRRNQTVERRDRQARGADELRDFLEVDHHDERRLRGRRAFGGGARQPLGARRFARRQAGARRDGQAGQGNRTARRHGGGPAQGAGRHGQDLRRRFRRRRARPRAGRAAVLHGDCWLRQSGSFVSAGAIVLVALMLLWFGLRPATKALLAAAGRADRSEADGDAARRVAGPARPRSAARARPIRISSSRRPTSATNFSRTLLARKDKSPQRHLQKLVEFDEEVAAAILKQWIRQGANT